jgi:uncharacterized protein with von Willebrand factor type A (vWA) domain
MLRLDELAADRLAGFPGFLRANGFAVGGGDAVQVLQTAQQVGVLDSQPLRWSLQALLCGRRDEWRRFDDLFDAWFLPANRWQRPERREADAAPSGLQAGGRAEADPVADDDADLRPRRAASRHEVLVSTDFSATDRARTPARHRSADATLGAPAQACARCVARRARRAADGSTCRQRSGAAWPAAARHFTSPGATAAACGRGWCC